ncbi:hypothetical protein O6H91_16G083900 [Diphasiastrum complanatum]|uniref:Uncharacterized protein n=1 Tax=Diphasiastrum complanatum TaxID=34168 RepID=A0ACC2BEG8_DIPCM|nr:hypothetical protein O6H91_16G083900 [Diphasiastrum complanatum]
MLENRENNQRMATRSFAAVPKDAILAANGTSQVTGAASGKNPGGTSRPGSGTKSTSLAQMENIRPACNKHSAPANFMRQTRASSKRAAMDDASQVINAAPDPQAKKRPALANLSINANIPASHVRASMSKTTKEEAFLIKPEALRSSQDPNKMAVDNDENVPPEVALFHSRPVKQTANENMLTASNSVPTSNKLPLQPIALHAPTSADVPWPINQVLLLDEKSPSKCKYTDIDVHKDPQMCSMYATDIYQHLRCAELKRRPVTQFMEVIQQEINASMRGILVDWLVEVAEEYKLVPDTLYLTVSYIDRFLSTNAVNRQRLQLVGVSCMLIAAKYEEICAPQVEEFCYITDNTYRREEVLEMERRVLNNLHFELTTPTTKTFLRRFIRAAQTTYKVASLQLEFLGNYLAELTLVEYNLLQYLPSMVAASAVFLAKLTLDQDAMPWNTTLQHYTGYEPSELKGCVKAIFDLQCNTKNCTLPAIREKYRQHKFKCVANMKPPTNLPSEYFLKLESCDP